MAPTWDVPVLFVLPVASSSTIFALQYLLISDAHSEKNALSKLDTHSCTLVTDRQAHSDNAAAHVARRN